MAEAEYDFTGKTVLISGAAAGMGRSAALQFFKSGANVLLCDVDETSLAETEAEVRACCADARSARVASLVTDVSVPEQVERMVQVAVEKFGKLDIAINHAGIEGERAPISEASIENFDRVMGVNARGMFLCLKYELAQMYRQAKTKSETSGEGDNAIKRRKLASDHVIVNTASTAGVGAMPDFAAYSTSKAAVIALTRNAAKEAAPHGVRVNAVCPSTTRTPMVARFTERWPEWQRKQNESFPMGRIGEPEEVADAMLWLASASSSFVSGTCVTIDGAHSA